MLALKTIVILVYVTCLWQDRYSALAQNPETEEISSTEKVPDLQVGCEEGYPNETPETNAQDKARKARSYFYRVETPASVISVWKPSYYRIQRPYYIPVYGSEGNVPIYFPPQPIYINVGFPLDNPPVRGSFKPNQGYLPPKTETTTEDMFGNRFGEEYPVWDTSPSRSTPAPPPSVIPTRRPKPARTTTVPPLVHNEPTVRPPSVGGQLENRSDLDQQSSSTPAPSQCVWAIINCCSAGSQAVSNSCFERFACPGPFWDRSPCESDFARLAIQTALDYYGNK